MRRSISTSIATTLMTALLAGSAFAGPVSDFENRLRAAYADYRTALFMTNMGKAPESVRALAALAEKWTSIAAEFGSAPPPQYSDDAEWPKTLQSVSTLVTKANTAVAAGRLPEAHEVLEGVRAAIGDLHLRNGLYTFPDRMNAYHAKMEEVLLGSQNGKALSQDELTAAAAVLVYLAADALKHPPAEALVAKEFAPLAQSLTDSAARLQAAALAGDPAAINAALGNLKPAYSKLFLKFG
jgi:hypothetical protein